MIVDPSHSGGRRDLVLPLTRAAIAVGADGVIVDVHPEPAEALCDGDQALADDDIRELACDVRAPASADGPHAEPAPPQPRCLSRQSGGRASSRSAATAGTPVLSSIFGLTSTG